MQDLALAPKYIKQDGSIALEVKELINKVKVRVDGNSILADSEVDARVLKMLKGESLSYTDKKEDLEDFEV